MACEGNPSSWCSCSAAFLITWGKVCSPRGQCMHLPALQLGVTHQWQSTECPQPVQGCISLAGLCVETTCLYSQLFRRCWLKVQDRNMSFLAPLHMHLAMLTQREGMGRSKRKILRLIVKTVLVKDLFSLKHALCKD